jgi:hypothetical protein
VPTVDNLGIEFFPFPKTQYCGQNLSSHAINGAVVTKFLIDGAEFF